MAKFIVWFDEIGLNDIALVGGKNASLGEMTRALTKEGISIPGGFAVTAEAYLEVIKAANIEADLRKLLSGLDKNNLEELSHRARSARDLIVGAGLPPEVESEILNAYAEMERRWGPGIDVAVRSSATAEDLPEASFAGQQESFLNVRGKSALLQSCINCFASLFTERAIAYRIDKGFDHLAVRLSIGVQKMVRSDLASAGVIFTLDPESGFRDVVLISSAYGLGENVVGGKVDPDEFLIFKPKLVAGHRAIVRRRLGQKQLHMVYDQKLTGHTLNLETLPADRQRFSLSDDEALKLAEWACKIESYYCQLKGSPTPMDIEWAKDGTDGSLYIVQARPETVHSAKISRTLESFHLEAPGEVLLRGRAVGQKISCGPVRVIASIDELNNFKDGEVLVADMTDPDWEPVMKKASAIVTNRGGRTCHAAIVSREMGLPCVVGTGQATKVLQSGSEVTISCADGEAGLVYRGRLPFSRNEVQLSDLPTTRTHVLLNLANPGQALSLSFLPVDGVGLAREEFIIATEVKIHPLALTRFDTLVDVTARCEIEKLTAGFTDKTDYFVQKLSEGIGTIAAAFYPREVIVRLSDFKTNEYANLIGGAQFEPHEENPMIGFRGASRYYDPRYRDGFALECKALKRVREVMGLTNVKLMVPFCRTVEEGKAVIKEMAANGLIQGKDGLEVYVMCELPSNVVLADQFAQVFDGFSIGSNDLTQLVLGLDRDSEVVAHLFDERNEAVKRTIAQAIAAAKKAGKKIGICGQAPSDYPDFARFLVELGIDSISLNEDAVLRTLLLIAELEHELSEPKKSPLSSEFNFAAKPGSGQVLLGTEPVE